MITEAVYRVVQDAGRWCVVVCFVQVVVRRLQLEWTFSTPGVRCPWPADQKWPTRYTEVAHVPCHQATCFKLVAAFSREPHKSPRSERGNNLFLYTLPWDLYCLICEWRCPCFFGGSVVMPMGLEIWPAWWETFWSHGVHRIQRLAGILIFGKTFSFVISRVRAAFKLSLKMFWLEKALSQCP